MVKQLTLTVFETEGCCGKHEAGISAKHRPLGNQGLVTCLFCEFLLSQDCAGFDKAIMRLYLKAQSHSMNSLY